MNDTEFLSYVVAHSQTQRALFSMEMIERLHQLADKPLSADLYTATNIEGTDFVSLNESLAAALVRAARMRMEDQMVLNHLPAVLDEVNKAMERRFKGQNPMVTIYGDGSWSVELDGQPEGLPACRVSGEPSGEDAESLIKFCKEVA